MDWLHPLTSKYSATNFPPIESSTLSNQTRGTTAQKGHEPNWVRNVPGKGWKVLLCLYGPMEPFFDKTWQLPDFDLVK